jgi:hypothetical protein
MVALAMLASAASLRAQTVRGAVVLADSATPARGVIVLATDERGATVGRTLTSERGEFTVKLGAAGNVGLTVLRIGFRPTVVPPMAVAAGAGTSVKIVLNGAAIALAAVTVRAQDECRVNPDSGLMVARVWNEAEKAILTSQLRAGGTALDATWIEYDRELDSLARFVRAQHVRTSENLTTHAFRSLPAEFLAEKGYVVTESEETTYYAPDADVLLSPSFAEVHCFQLVAPPRDRPDQAGLIGVGFKPVRDRSDLRDIEGTFWVDRATSELRSLDFRYTNLSAAAIAAGAGGTVQFLRLPDGNWLVSRWAVRMPRIGPPDKATRDFGKLIYSASNEVVHAVHVTGGEVTRVTRRDTVLYAPTGNALRVQAVARDTLVRAAGAILSLQGSDYMGIADSAGRIVLRPVLEGRYRARLSTPLMDSLGAAPVERDIEVRSDTHVDSLQLPSARDVLQKACPADSLRHGEGMLRGTVRDEHAQAMRQAAVTITWQDFAKVGDRLLMHEMTLGVLTDNGGRWRFCGVPRNATLTVRVTSDSGGDSRKALLEADQPMGAVDLVARRGGNAATGGQSTVRALVELVVYGTGGAPLPGTTLVVSAPGGATRTVVTGESGRALIPDVVPGTMRVSAKRIGFKPGQVAVRVEAGRNTVPILLSEAATPSLDTVRIVGGKRVSARLDEFETRYMNTLASASFNRADIEKVNPVDTWQMLSRVPSVRFIPSGKTGSLLAISSRAMKIDGSTLQAVPCFMSVMVDGLMMMGEIDGHFDLAHLPPPEDIHGIEVFAGAASIPPKYNGAGNDKMCGLIAIWTR